MSCAVLPLVTVVHRGIHLSAVPEFLESFMGEFQAEYTINQSESQFSLPLRRRCAWSAGSDDMMANYQEETKRKGFQVRKQISWLGVKAQERAIYGDGMASAYE